MPEFTKAGHAITSDLNNRGNAAIKDTPRDKQIPKTQ